MKHIPRVGEVTSKIHVCHAEIPVSKPNFPEYVVVFSLFLDGGMDGFGSPNIYSYFLFPYL